MYTFCHDISKNTAIGCGYPLLQINFVIGFVKKKISQVVTDV